MKELILRINNERLAESILDLVSKIKGVEIVVDKKREAAKKRSKIDELLERPYDIENFKIFGRAEIYERTSIY